MPVEARPGFGNQEITCHRDFWFPGLVLVPLRVCDVALPWSNLSSLENVFGTPDTAPAPCKDAARQVKYFSNQESRKARLPEGRR